MIISNKNGVFEQFENDLFTSFKQLKTEEREPSTTWKLGVITLSQWEDIKNICAFTNKEHSSECLVRLYYSPAQNIWAPAFYKQKMSYMTVKDEYDPEVQAVQAPADQGFVEAGSVHHHCGMGAFQSKTDEDDEQCSNGLHITIGKLEDKSYELHSRYSFEKSFTSPNMLSFFEAPDWLSNVPEEFRWRLQYSVMKEILERPGDPDKAREDWKKLIVPKQTTPKSYKNYFKSTPYNKHTNYQMNLSRWEKELEDIDGVSTTIINKKETKEDTYDAEDIHEIFADTYDNIIYESCEDENGLENEEPEKIRQCVRNVINVSRKVADESEIKYMGSLHKSVRKLINDARDNVYEKSQKSKINLTAFSTWLRGLNDETNKTLVENSVSCLITDREIMESDVNAVSSAIEDNACPIL